MLEHEEIIKPVPDAEKVVDETPKKTEDDILAELYSITKDPQQSNITQENQPTNQYSESELEAMVLGWKPKDQYTGNKKYRDADEFLEFYHLRKGYSNLDKQNKDLKVAVEELGKFLITKEQNELNTALEQIELKKTEAVRSGDVETFKMLEEQAKILSKQKNDIPVVSQKEVTTAKNAQDIISSDPELMSWVNKNPWIKKTDTNDLATEVVRNYAAERELEYRVKYPNCKHIDAFRFAEASTKTRFPDYKGFQQQQRPNSVESARNYQSVQNNMHKITINDLSHEQRVAVKKMCNVSKMNEQDYVDALVKSGAIKYDK